MAYRIFAPLETGKETGPWHYIRTVKRNEFRRARRTVVGKYLQPTKRDGLNLPIGITFPAMVDDQDYWYLYANGHPIGLFGRMGSHYKLPSGDVDQ